MKKIRPMLAERSEPFNSQDWLYEFKYNGTRSILYFENGVITLLNRTGKDITNKYPELLNVAYSLKCKSCILDGEVIVEKNGIPDFYLLQKREKNEEKLRVEILSKMYPAKFVAFDLLYLDGKSKMSLSLLKRKELLDNVVTNSEVIFKSPFIIGSGTRLYEEAVKLGFEGIMAKKKNSRYVQGRNNSWLKIKRIHTEDFVILGYTKDKKRDTFGSILVGGYRNGKWFYVSKVGNGFSEIERNALMKQFRKLKTKGYVDLPKDLTDVVFVKPKLVCEVEFLDKTPNRRLRSPVFIRLRKDKLPEECRYEILY